MTCSECYPNPPRFWRDAPMNEEIRKHLTWNPNAIVYHYTLDQSLDEWGENLNKEDYE